MMENQVNATELAGIIAAQTGATVVPELITVSVLLVWITEQLSKGSVTGLACGGGIEDVVQNSHFPTIQVQHSATLTVKTFVAVNGDTVEVMESTVAVLLALIIEIIENKQELLGS